MPVEILDPDDSTGPRPVTLVNLLYEGISAVITCEYISSGSFASPFNHSHRIVVQRHRARTPRLGAFMRDLGNPLYRIHLARR